MSSPSTPSKVSPSGLPAHQAQPHNYFSKQDNSSSKYTGQLLHPLPPRETDTLSNGIEALGLVDGQPASVILALADEQRAVASFINPRFGLVAIGLTR